LEDAARQLRLKGLKRLWNPSGGGLQPLSGFSLYKVSGLGAVELKLNSGETRRIATDDSQGLAAALRSAAP
jgi:hypothetical protein